MPIKYCRLKSRDLHLISQIDRSEDIKTAYEIRNGTLVEIEVNWDIPTWFVNTDGEHSLSENIKFCQSHLDHGGVVLGAIKDDLLVGVALVVTKLRERMAQLAFLHVSNGYRRQGIATKLMENACEIARDFGAVQMYISSIPSSSAVGFYLAHGSRLVEEPDPVLYALEPEDIHLVLDL